MKKMSATAVLVLMLVSASSAFADTFADASCSDILAEYNATKANIAKATDDVEGLEVYNAQIQTRLIVDAKERKDDSLILGNGQPQLRAESLQVQRLHANLQDGILRDRAKVKALYSGYMKKCSSYEKFE